MLNKLEIVGRYAPSPSGEQHLGNLRTALLAWLHARLQGGRVLLRMEDLDTPREVPGSAEQIIRDLEWLGLDWDGEIVYQSQRSDLYQAALDSLREQDFIYPCFCSRKDIRAAASAPHVAQGIYPGTCAALNSEQVLAKRRVKQPAMRIRVSPELATTCGDFVVKRADGVFAYQLAVVVDDVEQGVSEVVRGHDLADSKERQIYIAEILQPNRPRINYLHAPLMNDDAGSRMSKRYGSYSLSEYRNAGKTAAQLIAELAFGLDLIDKKEPITPTQLLAHLSLKDISAVLDGD